VTLDSKAKGSSSRDNSLPPTKLLIYTNPLYPPYQGESLKHCA